MALTDLNLSIQEAHEYLNLNGVPWSLGWVRTQVYCGRIASVKILSARAIPREELEKVVREYKEKNG